MAMADEPRILLVVDDDPRWRQTTTEILTDAGYRTIAAETAPDPLPECAAAVLDVSLSAEDPHDRGGIDLARRLQPAPVILLSGSTETDVAEAVRALPNAAGFLEKTAFRKEALLDLVRRALARPPVAPNAARILIVEDDPGWREIYSDILGDGGYDLQFAVSYGEARGLLQRSRFQAAVVDLHLISSADPEENRDGFALLRVAGARNLPTVVVSALGAPDDIDRAYDEFGVFAFIEKEAFDRKAFRQTMVDAIQSSEAKAEAPSSAPAGETLAGLTEREREVLALLAQGQTNRQIAEALTITPNTVKKHVDHVLQKLGVSTRAAAAAMAVRAGIGK
jgi:DNA-binding NarL/FixJ family response regulator